jgi:SAM-dependent methyltransferase
MPWFFAVIESKHEIQNPTSPEKIRLLGERLQLGPESHVLDIASGRGGPAILLAGAFGCRITCVEWAEPFDVVARRRVHEAGLDRLIELVHCDARAFPLEEEHYDVALCLGASFIWDGLPGTLAALEPAVRPDGFVVVGEPFWRVWPLPDGFEAPPGEDYVTLSATIQRFLAAGLAPVTLIDASLDDWDRYETLHWLAAEEWLHDHPDDPDAEEIRSRVERDREHYLLWQRDLLGWAIIVGRKRRSDRAAPSFTSP